MNTQNYSNSQIQNIPQPASKSVNFNDQPPSSQDQAKNYNFSQQIKIIQIDIILQINLLIIQLIMIFHQMMRNIIIEIIYDLIEAKDLVLTVLINQIFSNHTSEMNKYHNLEIIQYHTIIFFNHRTQSIPNPTNQLKCITKSHCHIIDNNMN